MLVNHLKEIFADDTLNLQKALEFIVENDEISTTLPLSHPILTAKVQPKLNAEYRNSVTVRRFKKGFKLNSLLGEELMIFKILEEKVKFKGKKEYL
jgi:hypothetical protein